MLQKLGWKEGQGNFTKLIGCTAARLQNYFFSAFRAWF